MTGSGKPFLRLSHRMDDCSMLPLSAEPIHPPVSLVRLLNWKVRNLSAHYEVTTSVDELLAGIGASGSTQE